MDLIMARLGVEEEGVCMVASALGSQLWMWACAIEVCPRDDGGVVARDSSTQRVETE